MTGDRKPQPNDEAETVLDDIEKPDPAKDPAEEIEERGAPDGAGFA